MKRNGNCVGTGWKYHTYSNSRALFLVFIILASIFPTQNLNPKSTGLFFLPVQHWGGNVFHPLCKIISRHNRTLEITGLTAYIILYKICTFKSSTITNEVIITKNNDKIPCLTLTFIQFDPENQEI